MKLLLDTHTFVWAASEPKRLSAKARRAILNSANERILSHASIWEIVIKVAGGKLTHLWTPKEIGRQSELLRIDLLLPIQLKHIYQTRSLPPIHADPFDRLLIAQAQIEGLRMISSDTKFSDYLDDVLW